LTGNCASLGTCVRHVPHMRDMSLHDLRSARRPADLLPGKDCVQSAFFPFCPNLHMSVGVGREVLRQCMKVRRTRFNQKSFLFESFRYLILSKTIRRVGPKLARDTGIPPSFAVRSTWRSHLGEPSKVKRYSGVRQRSLRMKLSYLPAPMAALNLSRWNSSLSK
jgi:hypothetical protein